MINRQARRTASAARTVALLAILASIPLAPASSTAAPGLAPPGADGFEPVGTARQVGRTERASDVTLSRHAAVLAYTAPTDADGVDIRMRVRGEPGDILVSWPLDGESQHELSLRPRISADGRYVVYDSYASNLVPDDDNGDQDVFLYDATTGVNTLVTRDPESGAAAGGGDAYVSMNGRYVVFCTTGALVSEDTNGIFDAYRYEVATGAVELVSRSLTGDAGNEDSFAASISGNGKVVAFISRATDLVEGPQADLFSQLYVTDMTTGAVRRISESPDGEPADSWTLRAWLDRTGHYLAFGSQAGNLVPEFSGRVAGVLRADLRTGDLELVSKDVAGRTPDDSSHLGEISRNGRFVTYFSEAEDLVPYDTVDGYDVFLYDTSYDVTYLLSHGFDATMADETSYRPAIGASARYVAFVSQAGNIVSDDDNDVPDVFLYRITRVGRG